MVVNEITLDLQRPNNAVMVHAVQGEQDARHVRITLLEHGTPWTVPAGTTIAVMFSRQDGTGGAYELLEDNSTQAVQLNTARTVATVSIAKAVAAVAGVVQMSLMFRLGGQRLISFPWLVCVHQMAGSDAAAQDNFFNLLFDAIADVAGLTTVFQSWASAQIAIGQETNGLLSLITQALSRAP